MLCDLGGKLWQITVITEITTEITEAIIITDFLKIEIITKTAEEDAIKEE